jgi:hypothetical protein
MSATKSTDLEIWWGNTQYSETAARESINVYTLDEKKAVARMMNKILESHNA